MRQERKRRLPAVKESPGELKSLMAKHIGKQHFTRLMVLYFVASGEAHSATRAAVLAGCDRHTAAAALALYAKGGAKALLRSDPGGRGRPGQLPPEAREYIQLRLEGPENCPRTWAEFHRDVTKHFPNTLSLNTFRNNVCNWFPGVRNKSARPSHPKKPPGGAADFKKN